MAKIEQLIEAVEELDLRRELEREVKELKDRLEFGLVFERHIPESVLLADQSGLQDGEQVRFRTKPQDRAVWTVAGRKGKKVELQDPDGNTVTASVGDLLVVKGFNEPIYPSLVSVGNVRRGGNHAPHLAIESENFHALELLRFTHAGQFDCIPERHDHDGEPLPGPTSPPGESRDSSSATVTMSSVRECTLSLR